VELDGYADGAADGGARPARDVGHDLIEHFALSDGSGSWLRGRLNTRRIGNARESGGSGRGIRRSQRALIARFLQRRLRWRLRCVRRRRWH
jgi:hypothetical protein